MKKDYSKKDLEVKRSLRKDKRGWANDIALEAEDAAKCGQMKGSLQNRRILAERLFVNSCVKMASAEYSIECL